MRDPELLVLDEPTAVLPPSEIGALLDICRRVADSGRAVILVTHKLAEIAKVADKVAVLRTGRLVAQAEMATADMGALVQAMVGREVKPLDVALAETDEQVEEAEAPKGFALVCDGLTVHDRHGASAARQLHPEIHPGEMSGWRASRATARRARHGASRPAGPTEGLTSYRRHDLTHAGAAAVTAAGGGIVPGPRRGLRHRHVGGREHVLNKLDRFTRFGLLQRGALNAAAQADARIRRPRRRPRSPFPASPAATSRRRCWAASSRSIRWWRWSRPSRRAVSTSVRSRRSIARSAPPPAAASVYC
jgi:simple sugar transport system ATP-binding protein